MKIIEHDNMIFINFMSIVFFIITLIFCISCAPKSTDLSRALIKSENIYNDLHSQVETALESKQLTKNRKQTLLQIQSKLNDYKIAHNQLQTIQKVWNDTNSPPKNTRECYEKMKKSLSEAVAMAMTVNIFYSECSGTTSLKGKTTNCY